MTRQMTWIGLTATLLLAVVLGVYTFTEPQRRAVAQTELEIAAVTTATTLYAENCVVCHGAAGEGLGATPALATDGLRGADYDMLYDVIARGRYNTTMPAWSKDAGGVLTSAQVDQLITLVRRGNWEYVEAQVAEMGLTPPTAVEVEVPDELIAQIQAMPGGDVLAASVTLYAENCAACHGANLEGTTLAPALDTAELRAQNTAEDLARTISTGVPGTLMAGWSQVLPQETIAEVADLILRWDTLRAEGVELPVIEVPVVEATPEMIAAGERLYNVTCVACHGASALGSRMAPPLNNQQFLAETPDAAIAQIIAGGVPGTMMPAWGGRLTDTDINSIVAYLRSLEPTAPSVNTAPTPQAPAGGGGPPWTRGG